jgi:hypothetical protein
MQTDINRKGIADLKDYHTKFMEFNLKFQPDSADVIQDQVQDMVNNSSGHQQLTNIDNDDDDDDVPPPPSLPLTTATSGSTHSSRSSGNGSYMVNSSSSSSSSSALKTPLDFEALFKLLGQQIEDEAQHKSKNVDLLLTSCEIARLLNAARTTSCKSAKDRTSVFQTLEVARIAERQGWLHR